MSKNHIDKYRKVLDKGIERLTFSFQRYKAFIGLFGTLLLTLAGGWVFYKRYPYAFEASNFYAEDGKVFMKNLIEKGPINGSLELFNGYLVIGQYFVGIIAQVINTTVGSGFITLAKSLAVSSYLFLGFVCCLPWLLFRKRLGTILAFMAVVTLWTTPMGGYDYAVIGTMGNLKFAFLFIAALLVIYRNDKLLCKKIWQFVVVDVALLLCVCTNIVTIGLLPLLLIRYYDKLKRALSKPSNSNWLALMRSSGYASLLAIVLVSFAYVVLVYLNGIPKQIGYLDEPLNPLGLLPISYRASAYGVFFPVNYLMNGFFEAVSLILLGIILAANRHRAVMAVIAAALFINVAGFVFNRPGVSLHFLTLNDTGWPGHFFFAGTMLVIFALAYSVSQTFNKMTVSTKFLCAVATVLIVLLVLPATGFTHANRYIGNRPSLANEVERVCKKDVKNELTVELYPALGWSMQLAKSKVCF